MKILVPQYKEDVCVPVHHEYDPKQLELEFVDLKYKESLSLDGTIQKGHDTLVFRGHLKSEIEHICGRCLKVVPDHIHQPFELFYEIKDVEEIDTTNDLREVVLLKHALNYLCKENCRGLCPHCGINRNEASCKCEQKNRTTAFSPLKDIWRKTKEKKRNG